MEFNIFNLKPYKLKNTHHKIGNKEKSSILAQHQVSHFFFSTQKFWRQISIFFSSIGTQFVYYCEKLSRLLSSDASRAKNKRTKKMREFLLISLFFVCVNLSTSLKCYWTGYPWPKECSPVIHEKYGARPACLWAIIIDGENFSKKKTEDFKKS